MPFNATVNLGTVGSDITGQTVSISGCTNTSCGSGCTSLATSQAVSSFPKIITGIPDNVVSLFIRVDGGPCVGTTQCIAVTQVGTTPTPTINASPTPTPTIGASPTPTLTPTIGASPTPTLTPNFPGCGDTISDTYAPSNYTIQTKLLDLSEATNGDTITVSYTANDRPNKFSIYGNGSLVASSLWAGSDPAMGTTYNGPWTGNPIDSDGTGSFTFTYVVGTSYELRVEVGGANPNATPTPNPSDAWSVTISCSTVVPTPTPTRTLTPTPTPFIAYCYEIIIPTSLFTDISGNKLRVAYQKYGGTPAEFNYDLYEDSGQNSPSYTINVCSISEPQFTYGSSGGYFAADGLLTVNGGTVTCSTSADCGGNDPVLIIPTPTASVGGSYCYEYQSVAYGPFETLQDCNNAINNNGHIGSCYECIAGPGGTQTS